MEEATTELCGKLSRQNCRKLFNRTKKSGDCYKSVLVFYNKANRDSKRNFWRQFYEDIVDVSIMTRVMKLMAKDRNCMLSTVKIFSGNFNNSGGEALAKMPSLLSELKCCCSF